MDGQSPPSRAICWMSGLPFFFFVVEVMVEVTRQIFRRADEEMTSTLPCPPVPQYTVLTSPSGQAMECPTPFPGSNIQIHRVMGQYTPTPSGCTTTLILVDGLAAP